MTLLDQLNQENIKKNAPLAERMRARTLDEFYGQGICWGRGGCCAAPWRRTG